MNGAVPRVAILVVATSIFGCPASRRPTTRAVAPASTSVARAGISLRGLTGDGELTFVALAPATPRWTAGTGDVAPPARSTIEARRGGATAWTRELVGTAGPLARGTTLVAALVAGDTQLGDARRASSVRGAPAAMIVALDAATGEPRYQRALESNDWVIASAIAPAGDDLLVAGSFTGSLRVGDRVVSSGGRSDGFVARLDPRGAVTWLVRMGGPNADTVQGVAFADGRIAVAGTFAPGADFQGHMLESVDEKTPYPDGFAAELDATGRRKWVTTFGGRLEESVVGVAIDGRGRLAVAANVRDVLNVGGEQLIASGNADGLVAFFAEDGAVGAALLLGGSDFDGLRAITAAGDHVLVGGFFSGSMTFGARTVEAGGGDDAFVVALDGRALAASWPITGEGREELIALAAVPGGFVGGVAYTARASIDGVALPAPTDGATGAAVFVRPVE